MEYKRHRGMVVISLYRKSIYPPRYVCRLTT